MDNIPRETDAFYWKCPPESSYVWRGTRRIDAGPVSFASAVQFCAKNRIGLVAKGYRWGPGGIPVTVTMAAEGR